MTFKDKITVWIYRKGSAIDEELQGIEQHIKYYPCDSLDHYEYMHAKIRLNAWKEFLDELFKLIINCK